jgi:hypothetical protein
MFGHQVVGGSAAAYRLGAAASSYGGVSLGVAARGVALYQQCSVAAAVIYRKIYKISDNGGKHPVYQYHV